MTKSSSARHPLISAGRYFAALALLAVALFLLWRSQNPRGFSSRGLVAKTVTELRILATAIEAYRMENSQLPPMVPFESRDVPSTHDRLTSVDLTALSLTPVSRQHVEYGPPSEGEAGYTYGNFDGYSGPPDLRDWGTAESSSDLLGANPYIFFSQGRDYLLISAGTDWDYDIDLAQVCASPEVGFLQDQLIELGTYDPTNGADSSGDIWRASRVLE